jgi:hypothetical protein
VTPDVIYSNATLPLFISDRRTDTMEQTGEDILASPYDVMEHFVILFRCHIGVVETVMSVVSNRRCMVPTPSHRLGIAKELAPSSGVSMCCHRVYLLEFFPD